MKQFFGILAFVILMVLLSCSKPPTHFCAQEDLLYQVESFYKKYPDSAERILDTLNIDVLSKKERAHFCLLWVELRDLSFNYDDKTDSLLQEAKRYFVGSKEFFEEARTCEALSRVGFKRGENLAYKIEWLQKAVESIKQCQHIDERVLFYRNDAMTEQEVIGFVKYKMMWRLGLSYLDFDTEKGVPYLRESFRYYEKTDHHLMQLRTAYILADAFLEEKDYDSCLYYYEKGRQAAEQLGDPSECATYYLSLAGYYQTRANDSIDNKAYLNQAIDECHKGLQLLGDSLFKYKDGFYSILSSCYFQLENWDSCRYFAEKHIAFLEEHHFAIVPNKMHSGIYYRLYQSYRALGDAEKALQEVAVYLDMQEKLEGEPKETEQIIKAYEEKLEQQRLAAEKQAMRYRQYLWSSIILLAFLAVCWLYLRNRKNREIENLKFQEELNKLQMDLEKNSQHTKQITVQRAFDIYRSNPENALEQIIHEFNTHYPETMERLSAEYPELNKTEQQIIILSFLGFRAKEEAGLMRLSENTVMKYRSNIKKKVDKNLYMSFC